MGKGPKFPVTAAVRVLRAAKVPYEPITYDYVPRGGTAASSAALGVDPHQVIKTLVMETQDRAPLVVLMHGDREVATGKLARVMDVKRVSPCDAQVAQRHSGYLVGGTSPFGTKRAMPVFAEASIRALKGLYINGGKRGFLVKITPDVLEDLLAPTWVEVAA